MKSSNRRIPFKRFWFLSKKLFYIFLASMFLPSQTVGAEILRIQQSSGYAPFISYKDKPAFGYGPSPQNILTYLPTGNGNNYKTWVEWAMKYKMNHVRSYPPSIIVDQPSLNVFHSVSGNRDKFDLTKFNNAYFEELSRACQLMKDNDFFVHLQLWQSVHWKKRWNDNYYNPVNNINPEISQDAGPGNFMVVSNPILLVHQKEYVLKILDSTAKIGNVFYDLANEIGNGTGSDHNWVLAMLETIRLWEQTNHHKVLVTINDEGGRRVSGIEGIFEMTDLIVKDLGRWDEHIKAQRKFAKPTISVRNVDWDYEKSNRSYFYGDFNLEVNSDQDLQVRGRKYWWRMFMARVQMAGGYADAYDKSKESLGYKIINKLLRALGMENLVQTNFEPSYHLNTLSEKNFINFRKFTEGINDYPSLQPFDKLVINHPAAHQYTLQSPKEVVMYIESPNGRSGFEYPEKNVTLSGLLLDDGKYNTAFYVPATGNTLEIVTSVQNGKASLSIPRFTDDLAIYIR